VVHAEQDIGYLGPLNDGRIAKKWVDGNARREITELRLGVWQSNGANCKRSRGPIEMKQGMNVTAAGTDFSDVAALE
jgi:hypothetical protein